jgi:hypothetical protein
VKSPGCENCRFGWEEPGNSVKARDHGEGWGACRRHAPAVLVLHAVGQPAVPHAAFPRVLQTDWCGDYQPHSDRTCGYLGLD